MKSIIKRMQSIVLLLCLCLAIAGMLTSEAVAGPAFDGTMSLRQPSGAEFDARQRGDEWYNWTETADGYGIFRNPETGAWEYYLPAAGGNGSAPLSVGTAVVGIDDPAALGIPKGIKPPKTTAPLAPTSGPGAMAGPGLLSGPSSGPFAAPAFGSRKVLVIGVDYVDAVGTYTPAQIQPLIFGATNSVADYYAKTSYNAVTINPAAESQGTSNDGFIGWIRLSGNHPNTGMNTGIANQQIAKDAILAADAYVDFSQFDTNSDGDIWPDELSVIVIVAGYETSYDASSPSIWGHQWWMWQVGGYPVVDGKTIYQYAEFGERHGTHLATIGIMAHELGHLMFNLPDLYDTDPGNGDSLGVGDFDLMASGSWGGNYGATPGSSPTQLSAWSKEYLSWGTVTTLSSALTVTFPAADGNQASIFRVNTSDPNQYFLLENRQFTGFDTGFKRMAGSTSHGGLAIYHIDSLKTSLWPTSNDINADATDKGVDVEEANHGALGYSMLDDYITSASTNMFFFQGNAGEFTNATTPNSKLKNGTATPIVINNISNYSAFMTASVCTESVSYSLAPVNAAFMKSGGSGSVDLTASSASCGWKATSSAAWLQITAGSSGAGNGTISYTVAVNNDGAPRSATLTIAGQTFTVDQSITDEDTTPDPFFFTDQTVEPNTLWESNGITVSGINAPAPISVAGGEYKINQTGVWTSANGVVNNGDIVYAGGISSPEYSTTTDVVLTIGGVSGTFSLTTMNIACGELISTGGYGSVPNIAINDLGEMVWPQYDPVTSCYQVFSNLRGQLTTDCSDYYESLSINNRGDVVWIGPNGISGIISGALTQIAIAGKYKPSINDSQEIVWWEFDSVNNKTRVKSNRRGWLSDASTDVRDPAINNAGDVVWVQSDGVGQQIYKLASGSTTPVAVTSGADGPESPAISNAGEIVWTKMSSPHIFSNIRGQVTLDGCLSALRSDYERPLVNSCGDIVFTVGAGPKFYRMGNNAPCVAGIEPNNSRSQSTLVSGSSTTTGMVQDPGDPEDWYQFTANAGEIIRINVHWSPVTAPNDLGVELYDANGQVLASPAATGTPKTITYTALYTGTYHVRLLSSANSKIGYNLSVRVVPSLQTELTVSRAGAGSGTITSFPAGINCGADCTETYLVDSFITLDAVASAGSVFAGWSGDPDCADGSVTMDTPKTCIATFTLLTYDLTVNTVGTGAGTVTGAGTYSHGTVATVTAIADAGSTFSGWSGDCSGTTNPIAVTMDRSKICIATFALGGASNPVRYIVWQDDLYGNNEIFIKKSTDNGATWSVSTRITNNASNSQNAVLAADNSTVYVAWQDDLYGNNEILVESSADGGTTWAGPYRITNNAGNSQNPVLATDGGTVYVVWQDDLYGNNDIYMRKTTDGGATWAGPYRITNNNGNSQNPVLATDGGIVYVVWQDDLYGNNDIYMKKTADGGVTWTGPYRITNNSGNSQSPSVLVSNGTIYIAWQDDLYGNNEILVRKSSDGGATWAGPYRITSNAGNSQNPGLATDGGIVYVVWQDDLYGNNDIYMKKTVDGGSTWTGPYRITNNNGNSQSPSLVVSNGTISVAWQDDLYGNNEIMLKRSTDGGLLWLGPYRLTTNASASLRAKIK